jgi:hypothetical protein
LTGAALQKSPFEINDLAARRGRLTLTIIHPALGGGHFFATLDGLAET